MRIGMYVEGGASSLDTMVEGVRAAADAGFDSAFFNQLLSWDALTVAAHAAQRVPGIDVGTAVVQTYPRHPLALAGQALTAQAISGGRLVLGIGPSHPQIIEEWFGYSYEKPARHVREYLTALRPLLRGEHVDHHGRTLTAVGRVEVPGAAPPPVLVSALGPVMLRIAGELADGTVTTWTTPPVIADHIEPTITRAATRAGRDAPRIVTTVMVSVTADPDGVRRRVAEQLGIAAGFPSYRAILDRQGLSGVHETIAAGDETAVAREVRRYAEAGTTELVAVPSGDERERARTIELLAALRSETRDQTR